VTHPAPLTGLRVLDFTRVYSGPFATLLLADLGAEVIKVEHPESGDDSRSFGPFVADTSSYFETLNRGKKSIAIDYTTCEGQALLRELAGKFDVVVENFRPGQMAKYGLDQESLRAQHPALVYVSITGFGSNNADSERGCYDIVAQGEGGLIGLTGLPHLPMKVGPAIGDALSGLMAATGLLAALYQRERTGIGAHVELSMVDVVFACLENALAAYDITGKSPVRQGNSDAVISPFDSYETRDGWIVIGIGNDRLWQRFAAMLPGDVASDPRFATNTDRVARGETVHFMIQQWCAQQPSADLLARLHGAGIPAGAVRSVEELACDARLEARGMLVRLPLGDGESVLVPGSPIKVAGMADREYVRGPRLGEHTQEVIEEMLGVRQIEVAHLM
jgi:CoA:oxalate CoA-transferase